MGVKVSKRESTSVKRSDSRRRTSAASQKHTKSKLYLELFKFYNIGNQIGSGHFGIVREGTRVTISERFAMKNSPLSLPKLAIKSIPRMTNVYKSAILEKEIKVLKYVSHPYILRYVDLIREEFSVSIVTELCPSCTLQNVIQRKGKLDESEAADLIQKLLLAVNYLHLSGISHRDIKPENVLVGGIDDLEYPKLIDFGLSRFIDKKVPFSSNVGTPLFMAPEMRSGKYNQACDIWSLGVTAYFLITGKYPFTGKFKEGLFEAIKTQNINFEEDCWEGVSDSAKDLVSKLLTKDPKKRITAEKALMHPWVRRETSYSNPLATRRIKPVEYNCRFQKEAFRVLSRVVPSHKLVDLSKDFLQLDVFKKGFIDLASLKASPETFKTASKDFIKLTGSKKGRLEYFDFIRINLKEFIDEDSLKLAFKMFDLDNDGCLSPEDIKFYFEFNEEEFSEEDLEDLRTTLGLSEDFLLTLEEFRSLVSTSTLL